MKLKIFYLIYILLFLFSCKSDKIYELRLQKEAYRKQFIELKDSVVILNNKIDSLQIIVNNSINETDNIVKIDSSIYLPDDVKIINAGCYNDKNFNVIRKINVINNTEKTIDAIYFWGENYVMTIKPNSYKEIEYKQGSGDCDVNTIANDLYLQKFKNGVSCKAHFTDGTIEYYN